MRDEPFFESSSRSILLFEHDLFGKPVPTFPDHALVPCATADEISAYANSRPFFFQKWPGVTLSESLTGSHRGVGIRVGRIGRLAEHLIQVRGHRRVEILDLWRYLLHESF